MKKNKIVWIALLCLLVSFSGCAAKNENTPEKSTEETQNTETQETKFYTTDEDCYSIETKYGTLEYPEKWKELTKIKIRNDDPYTVQFFCVTSAGDVPLFDLHFGGGDGFLLGTLPQDGRNISVYLDSFEIDQTSMTEEEYYNCCAMEEDVNVIISRLIEKNGLVLSGNDSTPDLPEDNGEVFAIQTKYGTLSYPEKWKELAKVETVESPIYTVKFSGKTSAGDIPLFDLTFNGGDGYCLGSMKVDGQDVTVYIDDYSFDQSTMSDEDYFSCCAMQEDVNVILQHLAEDYGFTFSGNDPTPAFELPEDNGEVFAIQTRYGTLSYPEKWKELAKTEIVESPIYTVKFSGKTSAGDIPLFDLTFNGGDGYCLGTMKIDGQDVTIYINDYSFNQSTMSDEDYFNCCAMQEDVNVILEHLTQDYGFTFG